MDWCLLLLMTEGHQSYDVLVRLPLGRLLELAEGVQAIINAKNSLVRQPPPGAEE